MEEEVGGGDEGSAEEEVGGGDFIGVVEAAERGEPGGEEEGEEGGEDRFDAIDEAGFGGADSWLVSVHDDERAERAEDGEEDREEEPRAGGPGNEHGGHIRCGESGERERSDGFDGEHDRGDGKNARGGEFTAIEPEDLAHEEDGADQGLEFAAAEVEIAPVELGEGGDAGEDEERAKPDDRSGAAFGAEREPCRDHDRVELSEKGGGGGGGELKAVGLEGHAADGEKTEPEALLEFETSDGFEGGKTEQRENQCAEGVARE